MSAEPAWPPGPVAVCVPATSANLGPGFDALGLALTLHDTVSAEVLDGPPGSVAIRVEGEGAGTVPLDATHLVHRSLAHGLTQRGLTTPALRLDCRNAVPHGRGLGSSSAAIVAGLGLARRLVPNEQGGDDAALLGEAARLEGHPDNVAPAVLGGLTIAWQPGPEAAARAVRLPVSPDVSVTVFVPPDPLATRVARGLLPPSVPHRDAAVNAGRAALLVAALTGETAPDVLLAATEDRLHQHQRASAMPASAALLSRLRAAGVAAVVSGAGPTVLAFSGPHLPEPQAAAGELPPGWRVLTPAVDLAGLRDC